MKTKFTDVKFNPKSGKVTGRHDKYHGDSMRFEAYEDLLAVELAMDLEPKSIHKFMMHADGYGEPGYFPGGYDWSGIRDSTPRARRKMFAEARQVLVTHKAELASSGLPSKLVHVLTVTH
jgi:hypothetical protein